MWHDPLLTKQAWTFAFAITALQLGVVVVVGYLWLAVLCFRKRAAAIGIVFLLLLPWAYFGLLPALFFGWWMARRWSIRGFMVFWSGTIALAAVNVALSLVVDHLTLEQWRTYFGWLPTL
jgi:hypothetical protein